MKKMLGEFIHRNSNGLALKSLFNGECAVVNASFGDAPISSSLPAE
jgi:hypothetical protein